jgi:hypothetical protein
MRTLATYPYIPYRCALWRHIHIFLIDAHLIMISPRRSSKISWYMPMLSFLALYHKHFSPVVGIIFWLYKGFHSPICQKQLGNCLPCWLFKSYLRTATRRFNTPSDCCVHTVLLQTDTHHWSTLKVVYWLLSTAVEPQLCLGTRFTVHNITPLCVCVWKNSDHSIVHLWAIPLSNNTPRGDI